MKVNRFKLLKQIGKEIFSQIPLIIVFIILFIIFGIIAKDNKYIKQYLSNKVNNISLSKLNIICECRCN